MKKFLSSIIIFLMTFQITTAKVSAENLKTTSTASDFSQAKEILADMKAIKEKAIKENKIFDSKKYEQAIKNARTESDVKRILVDREKYVVHREYIYTDNMAVQANSSNLVHGSEYLASLGSTRIVKSYYYDSQEVHASRSGVNLKALANTQIDIGAGWSHPAIGGFMSLVGYFIPASEYQNYTGITECTLYDYQYITKDVQVFTGSIWETMASAEKRDTYALLNGEYYKNNVRQTPVYMDLKLIKEQTGSYYNDEAALTKLAQHTHYPLKYYYWNGTQNNYNKDYLLPFTNNS